MPSADEGHQYIFKSGEYGTFYQYWWRDPIGNYYRYTNAPQDSSDFDPFMGLPLLDPEQPLPEKNPNFFTEAGYKRHMGLPEDVSPERNTTYSQNDGLNIWFEVYEKNGTKYTYLDSDVKENLDLYVQNQIRIVDANLSRYRKSATKLFGGDHVKDRLTGAILILCDQGFYYPDELVNATVGDIQFIDQAVILLGRKFVCDLQFLDFMTSLVAQRGPTDPLFVFDTVHGKVTVGVNYLNSVFFSLKVSPKFLLYWNASHLFSRIINRLSFQQTPVEDVESTAFSELARTLCTRDDVSNLVDYKVKVALLQSYRSSMTEQASSVTKSLTRLLADDFGIAVIRSDLTAFRQDEKEFSDWLQREPMHDMTDEEEAAFAAEAKEATEEETKPAEASGEDEKKKEPEEKKKPSESPEDEEESAPAPDEEVPE